MTMSETEAAAAEDVTDRLFGEGVGALHLMGVHLGVELGLYRHLAGSRVLEERMTSRRPMGALELT
ncbi:MAG: hypothetical protein OEW42_13845 [Acidimicrobiia bacterium]|nr:hypothetical protein [Acidimicrobiia bacterium]MDH5238583.1 hypothetical protein [Acidimicrobiia bacterium]